MQKTVIKLLTIITFTLIVSFGITNINPAKASAAVEQMPNAEVYLGSYNIKWGGATKYSTPVIATQPLLTLKIVSTKDPLQLKYKFQQLVNGSWSDLTGWRYGQKDIWTYRYTIAPVKGRQYRIVLDPASPITTSGYFIAETPNSSGPIIYSNPEQE